MTEEQNQQAQTADRVLEQSLPKPGVAEAMRFWRYTRPVQTQQTDAASRTSSSTSD